MINKYTDPIITNYRFDNSGSKITVPVTESLKITNGIIFLKEIPDKRNGTTISSFSEVQKPEDLDSENKFYVDYNTGVVYFDSKLNGTKVNVEYSGIGIVYYPASRIYLEVDENHEIIRTLSDIEGQLSSLTNLKNQQERLKQEIEERNGDLNKTIEEARKIDLSGSVDKANQAKTDLEGTTRKANIADANLRTDIEFAKGAKIDLKNQEEQSKAEIQKSVNLAKNTKTSLDSSVTSANDKINKASEKVNEISSKISEAKETQQKLTNTKNEITTSLSDYEKKSAEIKTSITEVDSKKTEIEESIGRANTSNDTLNASIKKSEESIKNANDININIDSSISKYKETEASIKAENEKATKNISDLDTKSASGKQIIDDLNSATLKSETAKTNLDESNTKAIQTNTDLKATTQTANETKTSLEQLKNESSTLSNELSESNTTASSNIESLKSENQSAKTNITGLQTENQNALSKQETLSSETEKANEAIERIAELITSSTDLKNKLEQIVASGDLDKYITDPKLREILTAYATKDDLSKIDVTSQLADYAKIVNVDKQIQSLTTLLDSKVDKVEGYGLSKNDYDDTEKEKLNNSISQIKFRPLPKQEKAFLECVDNIGNTTNVVFPVAKGYFSGLMSSQDKSKLDNVEPRANKVTSLSQLTDDETHRLVTDEEKNKWNNPPNPDLSEYATKSEIKNKADKASVPFKTSQLVNDSKYQNDTEVMSKIIGEMYSRAESKQLYSIAQPNDWKIGLSYIYTMDNSDNGKYTGGWLVFTAIEGFRNETRVYQTGFSIYSLKRYYRYFKTGTDCTFDESSGIISTDEKKWNELKFQNANMYDILKTKKEIQSMIASDSSFKKEVVDALPSSGEENVFYLVKDSKGKDGNSYLEYLWINGKWELIGSTQVDLSGYATKSELAVKETQIGEAFKKTLDKEKDKAIAGDGGTPMTHDGSYTTPAYVNYLISELCVSRIDEYTEALFVELDKKLDKTDLSPFTQQELEEAFK